MRRTLAALGVAFMVLGLAPMAARAEEQAREGRVRGTVITVGEISLVVQRAEGGQMTLEPGWVKVEGKFQRNQEQIAFFRTLKQGDQIAAAWKLDEGTHFCVVRIEKITGEGVRAGGLESGRTEGAREGGRDGQPREGAREGGRDGQPREGAREGGREGQPRVQGLQPNETKVSGTVVALGEEGRVVVQKAEGGQITLEPRIVRVNGRIQGHPEILAFAKSLKPGDQIEAITRPGEGGHFMNWGLCKPGGEMVGRMPAQPGGEYVPSAGMQAAPAGGEGGQRPNAAGAVDELRALRSEIGQLRQEIAALKDLVNKLAEKK